MSDPGNALRELPSVDEVLRTAEGSRLLAELTPAFVAAEARALIAGLRDELRAGRLDRDGLRVRVAGAGPELERRARSALAPTLVRVVNATGVVLHTNLGRAPWPERAIACAVEAAAGYSNLEYDLATGERGEREVHLGATARLAGAEAALVVNNNAAAVLLVLNTLADGRETVVSRGELVEIGGSFRIPDVLAKSGSLLREVGTTNRTRISDYAAAIGERTGLLLKVHPSNYRVVGFTEAVAAGELAALGRSRSIPVAEDLGSGDLVGLEAAGITGEPTVQASLAAGIDLVTVSGDKLLGGPQAGLILGREALVRRLRANPLYRALRPDKVTIAALAETLRCYLARDPWREVPVLGLLARDPADLARRAERLAGALRDIGLAVEVVPGSSTVGGGAAPLSALPSPVVAIGGPPAAAELARRLRAHPRPVVGRVEGERLCLDLRTVSEGEDEVLLAALTAAASGG